MKHYISADDAVSVIKTGHRVYIQGVAATPHLLIDAMVRRADELRNVEIVHLHTEGTAPYTAPEYAESFFLNALFVAANAREAIQEGRGDYVPVFLSDVPGLFTKGVLPLDVALIHVSPPDQHGICSLGTSVDCTWAAVHAARHVIAQVNPQMPRTHGDGFIHVSHIDALVHADLPLPESSPHLLSETEKKIGWHCANLIEDGATLQMGIGAIPDAVLSALHNHVRLGIHTEMFSDGVIELVEKGVITGECKKVHPSKIVTGFVMGTRRLYDFVDDNPMVVFVDIGYVNRTDIIRRNPRVTAINSAIEIDLTGQVCADSIGTFQFSGVGGQMDFIRGAALSEGGKPIIALPSPTSKGLSRIVPFLKQGAGVVTTRAHVYHVVTEYGAAFLYGKNLRQRARALIDIAHPDHRAELERAAFERFKQL